MLAVQVLLLVVLSLPARKVNWVSGSPAEPWAVQKGLSVSLALLPGTSGDYKDLLAFLNPDRSIAVW